VQVVVGRFCHHCLVEDCYTVYFVFWYQVVHMYEYRCWNLPMAHIYHQLKVRMRYYLPLMYTTYFI